VPHLGRHLWQALERGLVSPRVLMVLTLHHGLECGHCTEESWAPRDDVQEQAIWPRDDSRPVSVEAKGQLEELSVLDLEEGLGKIQRARTRFRSVPLTIALVQEVRTCKGKGELKEAHRFAAFAMAVAHRIHGITHWRTLLSLANAEAGDVARRRGDREQAAKLLHRAEGWAEGFRDSGEGARVAPPDVLIEATRALYQSRLLTEYGEIVRAYMHLLMAHALFRLAGREEELAEVKERLQSLAGRVGEGGTRVDPRLEWLIQPGSPLDFSKGLDEEEPSEEHGSPGTPEDGKTS